MSTMLLLKITGPIPSADKDVIQSYAPEHLIL